MEAQWDPFSQEFEGSNPYDYKFGHGPVMNNLLADFLVLAMASSRYIEQATFRTHLFLELGLVEVFTRFVAELNHALHSAGLRVEYQVSNTLEDKTYVRVSRMGTMEVPPPWILEREAATVYLSISIPHGRTAPGTAVRMLPEPRLNQAIEMLLRGGYPSCRDVVDAQMHIIVRDLGVMEEMFPHTHTVIRTACSFQWPLGYREPAFRDAVAAWIKDGRAVCATQSPFNQIAFCVERN